MRDVKRIDRILRYIEKYWKKNPDQRFFQMMINIGMIEDSLKLWNLEDDIIEKHLKKVIK